MAASLRIFGFPLRVEASFLLLTLFSASAGADTEVVLASFACTFVAILWHELGHAFAARFFGCTPSITLYWRGGLTATTVPEGRPPLSWKEDVAISVAGPIAGFVLGGLVWIAARFWVPSSPLGDLVLQRLLWLNLGWGALNLLPLQPWDGGLAARALLVRFFPHRGVTIANVSTLVLGTTLAGAALFHGWYWATYLAIIGPVAAVSELRAQRQERILDAIWEHWDAGRVEEVRRDADALVQRAANDTVRAKAIELSTFASLRLRDAAGAKATFDQYPSTHGPSDLLSAIIAWDADDLDAAAKGFSHVPEALRERVYRPIARAWLETDWAARLEKAHEADVVAKMPYDFLFAIATYAFYAKRYALARQVNEALYATHRRPDDAYNVACSLAQEGDVAHAFAWLERALEAGYADTGFLAEDADLAPLRTDARWDALVVRSRTAP